MATPAEKTSDNDVDLKHWLGQSDAADLLGVSRGSLANWTKRGLLKPRIHRRLGRSMIVYDPAELAAIPKRNRMRIVNEEPGEICARAFELFEQGLPLREVVIKVRRPVAELEALHEQWLEAGGSDLVITEAARYELARFVGDFAGVVELCERVRAKLGAKLVATAIDGATDAEIERAIVAVLDQAGAPP